MSADMSHVVPAHGADGLLCHAEPFLDAVGAEPVTARQAGPVLDDARRRLDAHYILTDGTCRIVYYGGCRGDLVVVLAALGLPHGSRRLGEDVGGVMMDC